MSVQFTVEDIRLLNLHYGLAGNEASSANGNADEEAVPVPVEVLCNSNYDEKSRRLKVTVAATIKDPQPSFTLSAEVGGLFHLDSDPDKEELDRLRRINCPAVLFPYLREIISEITRRGGFDPVYLPPMNFIAIYGPPKQHEDSEVSPKQ